MWNTLEKFVRKMPARSLNWVDVCPGVPTSSSSTCICCSVTPCCRHTGATVSCISFCMLHVTTKNSRLKSLMSTVVPYDFFMVSVLHFGHTTRNVPLPRGTDSTVPQPLHLK